MKPEPDRILRLDVARLRSMARERELCATQSDRRRAELLQDIAARVERPGGCPKCECGNGLLPCRHCECHGAPAGDARELFR